MYLKLLRKFLRYRRRLKSLPWKKKFSYVTNVLMGESFRKRDIITFKPRLIEFTLTHRCQCRCIHCYSETAQPITTSEELSLQEVFSILNQASEIGFFEVNYTGGEPLIREDIIDLVKTAFTNRFVTKINTNGILLTESMVGQLGRAGLGWGAVSIDSAEHEKHDRLRRYDGCFDLAVQAIKRLVAHGIPASITTYARKDSIYTGDLERIIQLGHELGVETVRILFPVPMGGFQNAPDEILNIEEREKVRELLTDPLVTMESPKEKTRCTAAVTKVNILPNGDVTPCVFVPLSYGNVRKQRFIDIWTKMREFDKMYKPSGQCPMCNEEFQKKLFFNGTGQHKF